MNPTNFMMNLVIGKMNLTDFTMNPAGLNLDLVNGRMNPTHFMMRQKENRLAR